MKSIYKLIFFSILVLLCIESTAHANIAPLTIKSDGIEPLENPGVIITTADIVVTPKDNVFIFNCKYTLKGLQDIENMTIGVPGDLGYTLGAGYINDLNINVNGSPVKYNIYSTTEHLSDKWKDYNLPLYFKWHAFTIPVKKDASIDIEMAYTISWRMFDQNKSSPYYIIPFILSTDRMFGDTISSYKIKYINDDIISIPDVKVMINSMLEPNIISPEILSPTWNEKDIIWEFKNIKEFQDFRLIVLSFNKLAMEFSTDSTVDHSIKWAALNNNYERLAETFEDIAKENIATELDEEGLGTAAYLSSEFYYRMKNYDKALEMLSGLYKITLWPATAKYEYINSIKLKEGKYYEPLLNVLKKLSQYKDYVLLSNYADNEIGPVSRQMAEQQQIQKPAVPVEEDKQDEQDNSTGKVEAIPNHPKIYKYYMIPAALLVVLVPYLYIRFKSKKRD